MHSHETNIAINMPVPRVERAVDEVERALCALRDASQSDERAARERFCLVARTAESQLRVTWGERGGHYRQKTFKRLADLLVESLAIIPSSSSDCTDSGYSIQVDRDTLVGRLAWIESILSGE